MTESIYSSYLREQLGVDRRSGYIVRHALTKFPGIGRKRADRIYQVFGNEAYEVALFTAEHLLSVPGITPSVIRDMSWGPNSPHRLWTDHTPYGGKPGNWHEWGMLDDDGLGVVDYVDMKLIVHRFLASRPGPETVEWLRFEPVRWPRDIYVHIGLRMRFFNVPVTLSLRRSHANFAAICVNEDTYCLPYV